jgi:hypothetical protein
MNREERRAAKKNGTPESDIKRQVLFDGSYIPIMNALIIIEKELKECSKFCEENIKEIHSKLEGRESCREDLIVRIMALSPLVQWYDARTEQMKDLKEFLKHIQDQSDYKDMELKYF